MFYRLIFFSTVVLLAGCASSQQASVLPVENPVVIAEPAPPALPVETRNTPVFVAADAAPANTVSSLGSSQSLDPMQCMMAWTKNVQNVLMPGTAATQAGTVHAAKR